MNHNSLPQDGRCALLLAHPGHELVVHAFVEMSAPQVAILTDGSGTTGTSRVDATTRSLEPSGASPTEFYGRFTDQQIYQALLTRDFDMFIGITEDLAEMLVSRDIECVVGDAAEGWNPVHDVWRAMVDEAVNLASARRGAAIRNYDFFLFAPHSTVPVGEGTLALQLDEKSYRRKIDAAEMYAELHSEVHAALHGSTSAIVPSPELSRELDARLQGLNAESYRVELLRPAPGRSEPSAVRVYELYGEMLVAKGRYTEAIRHASHLLPVEQALSDHVRRETRGRGACVS